MAAKKDPNNHLEQKIEELMHISMQTNHNITNLQEKMPYINDELRKNNENLTQLWITAKETLEKAKGNERRLEQPEETKDQM